MSLLSIQKLHASVQDTKILRGLSFSINAGEIHAIMGPNGSGKSTLANVLMGHPSYLVEDGSILFASEEIRSLAPNIRSQKGLFMVFQQPRVLAGVNTKNYLHTIYRNNILSEKGLTLDDGKKDKEVRKQISLMTFKKRLAEETPRIHLRESLLERSLNDGFSGGEKKKTEVLQMSLLKPKFVILDELDSGLDVDALKICCQEIMRLHKEYGMTILLITHFTKIFDYISPHKVHIMQHGEIVESGDIELAKRVEREGYLKKEEKE